MCDGKSRCLLWKRQGKFPDQNNDRIHENRECAVLKFAGQISADPGIRAEDWPISFRPTARHIGEYRQHRQFIIVIPKEERIVPEQNETEEDNE